jgi:hypothetical protein
VSGRELHPDSRTRGEDIWTLVGKKIVEASYPDDDVMHLRFDDGTKVQISGHGGIGADYLVVWFESSG